MWRKETENSLWAHRSVNSNLLKCWGFYGLIALTVFVDNYIRSVRVCCCILATSGSLILQHDSIQTASHSNLNNEKPNQPQPGCSVCTCTGRYTVLVRLYEGGSKSVIVANWCLRRRLKMISSFVKQENGGSACENASVLVLTNGD